MDQQPVTDADRKPATEAERPQAAKVDLAHLHRRVHQQIRARKNLRRRRLRLERRREALAGQVDAFLEQEGDLEADICATLRQTGAVTIGHHLYYPLQKKACDGSTYDILVTGNPRSRSDLEAVGRMNCPHIVP